MPLLTPILDDRSYQQLRDELVRRIPVYAPEWTDHNPSDPGITLIELFAFLAENLLFRFNQIPEATKLEFLRLLDVPLRPAAVAETLVELGTTTFVDDPLPRGTVAKAGAVAFETDIEAYPWPLSVLAMARIAGPAPVDDELRDFAERAIVAHGGLRGGELPAYYSTAQVPLDPSAPDAQPVDVRAAVDGTLWIAVLASDEVDPDELRRRIAGRVLSVGVVPDERILASDTIDPCPGEGDASTAPAMQWQASTGHLHPPGDPAGAPVYAPVKVLTDTTGGLTKQGVLQLELPSSPLDLGDFDPGDPDRVGTGDLPPGIDDEELASRVLFWLRVFRPAAGAPIGRILWVGANAVGVRHARRAGAEFVGVGTGEPDQRYRLVNRSVLAGTLALDVEEPGGWQRWQPVDDFLASQPDDRHYVLDLEAGEVRFGTLLRARVPQIGERIRALEYRFGGGLEGNVAARAIDKLEAAANVTVINPLPARGGAAAETVVQGIERIPGELRRRDRAVTTSDFSELALQTPGAGVARAECLPRFHRTTPDQPAAGVVSVVVWPREDPANPNAPMPDRGLLRAVCRWLDSRRLVTTELHVIPPTYRKVAVAVGLQVEQGYGVEAVRRWVELVLRQYLAPLPPFGPGGGGWPLGHRVHAPELEAAALQVEGVDFLEGLTVAGLGPDGATWVPATTVQLRPFEVVELAEVTVVQGQPMPPGVPITPPSPDNLPVPIPVPRQEC
jgi:Baseplate J-like protein